ncbi:MAG: hypothetical protein ACRELD_02600 [Longimicrobiales bacterium]
MRAIATTLLVVTATLVVCAADAAAQSIQIVPKIGAFKAVSDLGEISGSPRELEGSLAVGLAAELGLGSLPFDLRANFDYATDTEVSSEGIGDPGSASGNLLAVTGDLVFRVGSGEGLLAPYLLAGGGLKRYDINTDEIADPNFENIFDENQTKPTGHLGLGLGLGLGLISIVAELSDYISQFEAEGGSELQHDVFGMLGVRVRLF